MVDDTQAQDVSEFRACLRRLGTLKKDVLKGRPSDRVLAEVASVSPTTVGDWLRGTRLPQSREPLLKLIGRIRTEAATRGLLRRPVDRDSGESVAELLDEQRWRDAFTPVEKRRSHVGRQAAEAARARAVLNEQQREARQRVLREQLRPVRSWTARKLGVHPAIGRGLVPSSDDDFVLPTFVPRPHDERLRSLITTAADRGESALVLVRGDSCTGKTRSAVEAAHSAVPDWTLLRFVGPDGLLDACEADAIGPRTVLWLDDGHHYLYGTTGERLAAALLRRLDQGDPVLILTTLWRVHEHTLTTAPPLGQEDTHAHARALLAQAQRVLVPADFADELDAVRRQSRDDASLAEAVAAGTAAITQTLAAGPELLDQYDNPVGEHGFLGRALITAAMDARRLGVTDPLPLDFLKAAAPGYLTGSQRALADPDTWFTHALACARITVKQVVSALHDVPHPSGMGPASGVVGLANYLEQHGRATRRLSCPPEAFWTAAPRHLGAADVRRLARAAVVRGRYRHAAALYQHVADRGDAAALALLGQIRETVGERADAERVYREAVERGNVVALIHLAKMRERQGRPEAAESLYAQAADKGNIGAVIRLARARERAGDLEGAADMYARAADMGHAGAAIQMARLREESNDPEGAEQLYRRAAEGGGAAEMVRIAQKRERKGDWDNAERLYRLASESGETYALVLLARLRKRRGDEAEAESLYQQAADRGNTGAMVHLAQLREKARDLSVAEQMYQQAVEGGNTGALLHLARMKDKLRDPAAAEAYCRAAAEAGETQGLILLAGMRKRLGYPEEAEDLYREAAASGGAKSLFRVARLRHRGGEDERAALLYQQAAEEGNTAALIRLARMKGRTGHPQEAERLYRSAADAGDANAVAELVRLRANTAQPLAYGLEPDGSPSAPW